VQKPKRTAQANEHYFTQLKMDKNEHLMETEDLTTVRIRDNFVRMGRIRLEFMDWIKLWITGFLAQFIASYST
jgi:hypothetical protein